MHVSSEVQVGLLQTNQLSSSSTLVLQIVSPNKPIHCSTSSVPYEDPDGDLVVPRKESKLRRKRPKRYALTSTSSITQLQEATSSNLQECGTQLWRGALLLSELLLGNSKLIENTSVIEVGCGIGLVAIIASRYSHIFFAADNDLRTLKLTQTNIDRNAHGPLRVRYLDWTDLTPVERDGCFGWTSCDITTFQSVSIILARYKEYDRLTWSFLTISK
uniref:AlNc14C108G6292 protein n=1 Tax=Albugo laibachii Nc14 TaxID=890382 RepID=F0WI85_9STRA|nr:AlNc14C108G6292 [Albugo laibachii Nc14]|eukprot:CCA20964.1 AlNc14C108G6292 [Albugo laibachii Nc14]